MRLLIFLLLSLLVFFRYQITRPDFSEGQRVRISKKVLQEPVRYDNSQYLKLYGLKIYLPTFPEIYYGDFVVIEGVIDDGRLKDASLLEVKKSDNFFFSLRKNLVNFYQKSLPDPHSALIAGMVIGSKEAIGQDFWEILKKTGTAHVVVASGMNVTLIAGFFLSLFLTIFPRKTAVLASILGIWIYSFISGFDAPIIRAAIMGSLAFGAQGLGRVNLAWRALIVSIFVMLFIKPDWLIDLGFILSVVATASLMLFEARIKGLIGFVPSLFREGFSTSLAAQIGVAPILYATFGQFNILSPVINALILWTVAPVTVIGMVSGVVGLLSYKIGSILIFLCYPLTSWFIFILNLFK